MTRLMSSTLRSTKRSSPAQRGTFTPRPVSARRAQAEGIGRQLVADDAEEVVVDVERFDRRVGAVAERRGDRVAAVRALRRAVAAAEDLEIDAITPLAEVGEAERRRTVVAGRD